MTKKVSISRIIKAELKKEFPSVKFSVTSDSYSAQINWTNGPSCSKVAEITSKYEMGHFDGMTDCYEFSNCRDDIPQVKYLFLDREISQDILEAKFQEYKKRYSDWEHLKDMNDRSILMSGYCPQGFIRHKLSKVCL